MFLLNLIGQNRQKWLNVDLYLQNLKMDEYYHKTKLLSEITYSPSQKFSQ